MLLKARVLWFFQVGACWILIVFMLTYLKALDLVALDGINYYVVLFERVFSLVIIFFLTIKKLFLRTIVCILALISGCSVSDIYSVDPFHPDILISVSRFYIQNFATNENYCTKNAHISIESAVIKICRERDQLGDDFTYHIISFYGNDKNFINGYYNNIRNVNIKEENVDLPFGIVKYQAFHILDQYYLLIFNLTSPVPYS